MHQASLRSLRQEFTHPLARMLPLFRYQEQVYRMAEKSPPGLEGYQPRWEVVNAVLGAQQQLQVKVDLMTDFQFLAILCGATVNTVGGFRVFLYDKTRNQQIGGDRGIQFPNLAGSAGAPFFLREPYAFDLPQPQALVILQNMEPNPNTVQLVLYGLAAPFQGTLSNEY